MKFSLRKGYSNIHFGFNDDDYSNSIAGEHFEIEHENSVNRIHINIESNLKPRNRLTNSYSDTRELIRKAEQIKFVQIDNEQVIRGLLNANNKYTGNIWELVLHVGDEQSFKYIVKPSRKLGSVFLYVIGI